MNKSIYIDSEIQISFTERGKGTPLIFIHGLGSNKRAFEKNIIYLEKYYRCISLDLPGYGGSTKLDPKVSLSFYARSVVGLVKKLNIQKAVVVGHSMGAQIAVITALMENTIVDKLILTAPAGFEVFNEYQKTWFESISRPEMYANLSSDQIIQNFELNFYDFPEDAAFMIEDRFDIIKDKHYFNFYCKLIHYGTMSMLNEPVFGRLKEIRQECLVVFGTHDQLIPNRFLNPKENPESIARTGSNEIRRSSYKMIDRAGHFVMWEQADQFNALLHQHLEGIRSKT